MLKIRSLKHARSQKANDTEQSLGMGFTQHL